jgi:hypothetical protein
VSVNVYVNINSNGDSATLDPPKRDPTMKTARTNIEPITSDFSPGSQLEPGKPPSAKVAMVTASIVLTALVVFFGVVHY